MVKSILLNDTSVMTETQTYIPMTACPQNALFSQTLQEISILTNVSCYRKVSCQKVAHPKGDCNL